ncbi:MAG: TonB-dependent receptor [Thermoanaerobaculia bacterium]|nr:TonB-dependent receptor [Thermoanaerobaculia bacterium]
MHRHSLSVVMTLAALLLVPAVLFGQAQAGNLFGKATDTDGTALPGVTVTVTGPATSTAITNDQGDFRFLGLSPGAYHLTAELDSFSKVEHPNVQISVGRNTTLDVTLDQAIEETITVTSESPLLDSRKITSGSSVTALELEKIPTSRDPWVILQTVPGVQVDRVNVGGNESGQQSNYVGPGSSGDEAVWAVDGVVITDMAAIGGSPTYYNFDAFQEMQAATGGSDASLATGGVTLNMVTKRGGNEWKGSGRYISSSDSWQSDLDIDPGEFGKDFDGPGNVTAQAAFKQGNRIVDISDYGFEIGGPVVQDKLWIWANWGVQDVDLLTVSDVPDNTELDSYGAKVNYQPAASNSLVGFYNFGDKVKIGRNAGPTRTPPTTWNQTGPTDIFKLEDTHVFSSSFFLTGLASYVSGGFQLTPQGGLDGREATWDTNGVWQHNYLHHETDRPQEQVKFDGSYFFDTGSVGHELKFGVGYRTAELTSLSQWPGNGARLDIFGDLFQLTRPAADSLESDYTSLYVQDTITSGNLTANVGLRYDLQDGRTRAASVPALAGFETLPDGTPFMPAATSVPQEAPFEWEDITPRLGVTYAVGADRQTLLRASLSQFVQQLGQGVVQQISTATASYAYFDYVDLNGDGFTTADELIGFGDGAPSTNGFDPLLQRSIDSVDSGLEGELTTELIVGVEHAVKPELVVGLTATARNIDRLHEQNREVCDVPSGFTAANCDGFTLRDDVRSDYVQAGTTTVTHPNGSTFTVPFFATRDGVVDNGSFLLKNGDREQDYLGFSLSVNKRLSNRWMLRGNFTISEWEWNLSSPLDDPNIYLAGGGRDGDTVLQGSGTGSGSKGGIYINSNWSYSITGMYQIAPDRNWGFNIAASVNGREGYALPYFVQVSSPFNVGTNLSLSATTSNDTFRLDDIHVLDLRVEKEFEVSEVSFTLGAEVFNVFNEATVLQRQHNLGLSTANHIQELLSPRVARVSLRFNF